MEDRAAARNLSIALRDDASFDPRFRSFVDELRLKLEPVSDVISLADVDNVAVVEGMLEVEPLMTSVPESGADMAKLAAQVFGNETFVNGSISQDTTGTAILVELSFYYDDHLGIAHRLFGALEELTEEYPGPEDLRLAGVPTVNVYTSIASRPDSQPRPR